MTAHTSIPAAQANTDAKRAGFGLAVWVVFACAIVGMVLAKKQFSDRSVTPEYHRAAIAWWNSEPLYSEGVHGFLYMPQAAMAYTPFALMPAALEEITWRLCGILLYAFGIRGLCRRFCDEPRATGSADRWRILGSPGNAFLIASALGVFAAMGSAQNGQTNLHMGGLFALGACAAMDGRWWRATLWFMLALALKPTALVMVLLFGAIWWRDMSWRLAIGVATFLLAPLLHPHPSFVVDQCSAFIDKSRRAAAPTDLFQDIRGMLVSFHVHLPEWALTGIRAGAAIVALGLGWLATRRFGRVAGALFALTLGTMYLMLFNPRTEGVTYAILGPAAGLWATREVIARRWTTAVGLIAFCLVLQFSRLVTGGGNYWVRPLGTLLFASLVITEIARNRTRWLRPADDRCAQCGYDLAGFSSSVCPECGSAIPPRSRETPPPPRPAS